MEYFRAGRAVVLSGGPDGTHLWFIITDPHPQTNKVLAVRLLTLRGHTDKTLILDVGDHPFITHESSLDCGGAEFFEVARLRAALEQGKCTPHADMTKGLLKRVREAVLASGRTIHFIRDYCRKHSDP